jgi:signal transduction histidine kinase
MVVDEAQRLIGSDGAHLTLITADGQELVPAVVSAGTAPETQDWLTSARFRLGEGLHGQVAVSREVRWTDDSLRDRDAADPSGAGVPAGRTAIRAVAVAPLNAPEGGILGTLAISYEEARPIDDESLRLLATLADHAAVSITAGRLEEEVHVRAAELAASEERSRLARELHDSVTQALFSMTLQTRAVELLLDRDIGAAREKLGALRDLQRDALAEMRSLIFELRPGGIAEQGLVHALRTHATAIQGRIGLPVEVDTRVPVDAARPPIETEEALYRIAQEALHNVVRHATARQVRVELVQDQARVRLVIADDGVGFDPEAVPKGHLGLEGMRARVSRLGGRFEIATRPGGGTRIIVTIPLAREAAPA